MRRISLVLSVAMIGVGLWILVLEHTRNANCNVQDLTGTGYGASSSCLTISGTYFAAFIILIVGILALAFTLLMMTRRRRYNKPRGERTSDRLEQVAARYRRPSEAAPPSDDEATAHPADP